MVIFGEWEQPPLWQLRNKLLEHGITRDENISGREYFFYFIYIIALSYRKGSCSYYQVDRQSNTGAY